jgi:D-threo-aldose 1-dehydrogenase
MTGMVDPLGKRTLGKRGPAVTQLGFGGVPIADFWSRLPEIQALGTVEQAAEAGLELFDTSPLYGHGLSEHRIGHVLRQRPRESFILSTKVGRILEPKPPEEIDRGWFAGGLNFQPRYDYSYDGAMRSVEHSLHRLGLHRIDVLLIHDVDIWTHGDLYEEMIATAFTGALKALRRLRDEKVVKAIGIGVNEIDASMRFARGGDIDTILLAGRYTLLEHKALDELLPLCTRNGVGIMLGGPYNSGILATGAVPGAKYDYKEAPPAIVERVRQIEKICQQHGVPVAAAALQFPLGHPAVSSMIPGAALPEEVDRNLALMRHPIPPELWASLKKAGLMPEEAPIPA